MAGAKIAVMSERRPYQRYTREEDELSFSYRYHCALGRIRTLEAAAERAKMLGDEQALSDRRGVRVSTYGACLPAIGTMLWHGGTHALVWFDGTDAPVVWPLANVEIALMEAAE
jgi:hypothetical protein